MAAALFWLVLEELNCDALQNMLDHMLSIHVRSRVFATLEDAAQFIKSVSMLYEAYVETKKIAKLKVRAHILSMWLYADGHHFHGLV